MAVQAADYGVVVEYYIGMHSYDMAINSDKKQLIGLGSENKKTPTVNQFNIVQTLEPHITPITATETYNFPDKDDEYLATVAWGSGNCADFFYVQGFYGALFEKGKQKVVSAQNVISNDGIASLLDPNALSTKSSVFVAHHEETTPYNITLQKLDGQKIATYNTSQKYYNNYANSMLVNEDTKELVACYRPYVAIPIWDIKTAQLKKEVLYPNNHAIFGFQVIYNSAKKIYILGSNEGVFCYDPNDKNDGLKKIIDNDSRTICLVDENTLVSGNTAGKVQWFDMKNYTRMGELQLNSASGENSSINSLKKIDNKTFLAAVSNGLIYQLRQKN